MQISQLRQEEKNPANLINSKVAIFFFKLNPFILEMFETHMF